MKSTLLAGACATALMLGAATSARADGGIDPLLGLDWYVSLFGGGSFMDDYRNTFTGGFNYRQEFDEGFIVGGAVGAEVYPDIRGEVELSYQFNDARDLNVSFGAPVRPDSGEVEIVNLLFNLWYDINLDTVIKPYIGGGIGIGFVDIRSRIPAGTAWSDTETAFAFQVGGGFKYAINNYIDIDLSYRFRGVLDVEVSPPGAGPFAGGAWLDDDDLLSHTVHAGITLKPGN